MLRTLVAAASAAFCLAAGALVERPPELVGKIDYTVCFRDKVKRMNTTFACPEAKFPEAVGKFCYAPCPKDTPAYDPKHPQHCYEACKDGYVGKGNKCVQPKDVKKAKNEKCPSNDICGTRHRANAGCATCPDSTYKLERKFHLIGGKKCECVRKEKHYYVKHNNRPWTKSPGCPDGTTHIHKRKAYPSEDLCYSDCEEDKGFKPMWTRKGVAMCEWTCVKKSNLPYTKNGLCCKNRGACKEIRHKVVHDGLAVLHAHKDVKKHPDDKDAEKAQKAAIKTVVKDFLPPNIGPKCSKETEPNAELFDEDPFADLLDADDEIENEDMVDLRLIMGNPL